MTKHTTAPSSDMCSGSTTSYLFERELGWKVLFWMPTSSPGFTSEGGANPSSRAVGSPRGARGPRAGGWRALHEEPRCSTAQQAMWHDSLSLGRVLPAPPLVKRTAEEPACIPTSQALSPHTWGPSLTSFSKLSGPQSLSPPPRRTPWPPHSRPTTVPTPQCPSPPSCPVSPLTK